MKKIITEKDKVHEHWYLEAREIIPETLPAFVSNLMSDYEHDHSTACHAVAAINLATVNAIGKKQQGGELNAEQKHAITWKFIHSWLYPTNTCGLRLVNYDEILFKENKTRFVGISKETWKVVQQKAKEQIEKVGKGMIPNIRKGSPDYKYWESIVAGKIPFGLKLEK